MPSPSKLEIPQDLSPEEKIKFFVDAYPKLGGKEGSMTSFYAAIRLFIGDSFRQAFDALKRNRDDASGVLAVAFDDRSHFVFDRVVHLLAEIFLEGGFVSNKDLATDPYKMEILIKTALDSEAKVKEASSTEHNRKTGI